MDILIIEFTIAGLLIFWFLGYVIYSIVTSCKSTKNTGDACTKNCECVSGGCGKTSLTSPVTCCSGSTTTFQGLNYCADVANGGVCVSNGMCASGLCKNGVCVSSVCDSTCATGCGLSDGSPNASVICCPNGTVNINGIEYCKDLDYGKPCQGNSMCGSGECTGFQNGVGYCNTPILPLPLTPCQKNSDCKNGACARAETGSSDHYCCPSGDYVNIGFYAYCTDMPKGTKCSDTRQCKSGVCSGGVCL